MIVKICHPKREDHFLNLSRYLRRDTGEKRDVDSFATLSRYMTRDEDFKVVATNCGCDEHDIDTAEKVVEATQNLNTRARKKSLHLVVSFTKGERPKEEQLALIEHRLLASVGMADLQRIRVVHDDTDNLHMHIAVNRIHPETLRSIQPTRDYEALQDCARELELELGLERLAGRDGKYQHTDLANQLREQKDIIRDLVDRAETWHDLHNGLATLGIGIRARRNGAVFISLNERDGVDAGVTVAGSAIDRTFSRNALEKRLGDMTHEQRTTQSYEKGSREREISDEALRQERHRGTESFQTWALNNREEILNRVDAASTWEDVHQSLADLNLGLVPFRAGLSLVNTNGRGAIAASRIDRSMSCNALEERFGEYESPAPEHSQEQRDPGWGYTEKPHVNPFGLWDKYVEDRDVLRLRYERERKRRQDDRDRAYEEFAKKYAAEAQSIRRNLFLDRFGKRMAFNRLARRRKQSYERLKSRSTSTHGRGPPSYRQWLLQRAMTGDVTARSALREISARLEESVGWDYASSGHVGGEAQGRRARIRPSAVFRNGAVEINHGGVPLIDDGHSLHVTDNELESVRALLDSARTKYKGPIEIQGGDEFKASVAICAIDMPELRFADRDLQQQVDLLRTQQRRGHDFGIER